MHIISFVPSSREVPFIVPPLISGISLFEENVNGQYTVDSALDVAGEKREDLETDLNSPDASLLEQDSYVRELSKLYLSIRGLQKNSS